MITKVLRSGTFHMLSKSLVVLQSQRMSVCPLINTPGLAGVKVARRSWRSCPWLGGCSLWGHSDLIGFQGQVLTANCATLGD